MTSQQPDENYWKLTGVWETHEELEWLALLQKDQKARHVELLRCKKDPYYFITHWCHTIDSSDEKEPEKLFPNKIHLKTLTHIWLREKTLLVPKSRQMSATWLFTALYLWDAFFYSHRLTFFQSKKESDAAELILRTGQMYSSLPWWMKEWNPMEQIYAYMEFAKSRSRIYGIASGADQIRGFTSTGVFVDEAAYVLDLDKMIMAVRPAIRGGGRLTMVSSAAPGHFANLVLDN